MKEIIITPTRKLIMRCIETGGWTQQMLEEHAEEILDALRAKTAEEWVFFGGKKESK